MSFEFSIIRIKEIHFSIDEKSFINDPSKKIKVELGRFFEISPEKNIVRFVLRAFYHYEDMPEKILVDISVENLFQVPDIKSFPYRGHLMIFPENIIISIVGVSVSHARALLSKNIAGTIFQDVIIPITNPREVAEHFFPYMFDQTKNSNIHQKEQEKDSK